MSDTIVLLTGPGERETLAAQLQSHNPRLTVRTVGTLAELETIERAVLRRARLIAFLTHVVVPQRILDRLGFGAYNFHPGPPDYPGWVPSHFAIYNKAASFGATAHVMTAEVDAGSIIGVELFDIPADTGVLELERLAFVELARLFWKLAKILATQAEPLQELPISWCGPRSTRRKYEAMCDIPPNISKEELERRLNVFGDGHFGIYPTITMNGHRFRYLKPEGKAVNAPSIAPAHEPDVEPVG